MSKKPIPTEITTSAQARKYVMRQIRKAEGSLSLDSELLPTIRQDPFFFLFRHAGAAPDRSRVLNFLTTPGSGFVVIFDGQTVWIHSRQLPEVPTNRRAVAKQASPPTKKKPRRHK
jgi:hypothetical protein